MKRLLQIVLPLLVVALGVAALAGLALRRPTAARADKPKPIPRVEYVVAQSADVPAIVRGSGVVSAAREVTLSPQVSGRVTWQHPALALGGRVKAGDVLIKIDDRDFRIAVEREQSRVEQAALELQLEESRRSVAEQEWQLLGEGRDAQSAPLALRVPQLENARRQLEAAKLAVRQAELNLERTHIRAPFDAMVTQERAELGQVLSPGMNLATLIATDVFWVTVSLPVDALALISWPEPGKGEGSPALLWQSLSEGKGARLTGRVLRVAGALDPQTRTAQVLVEVPSPLDAPVIPLLPGAFVEVELAGRSAGPTFPLPRAGLVEGNQVWLIDADNRLAPREVAIAWSTSDVVHVTAGLSSGDRVLVTALTLPVAGMQVDAIVRADPSMVPLTAVAR